MFNAAIERVTFAAGELSPELRARSDLARQQTGLIAAENVIVLLEGGLTRRPGTKMVWNLKDETQLGALIPFRYSGSDAYMLVFNAGVMRILWNGGIVTTAPNTPFELVIPYLAADLANLRWAQSGNAIYLACDGYQPRVLTRVAQTNWTLALYTPAGGPVGVQNLNKAITIQASAATGNGITLTGAGTNFSAGDVGGVYRLDEPDLTKVPEWQVNETITSPTNSVAATANRIGDMTNAGGGGLAAIFDGVTNQSAAASALKAAATNAYAGIDFGAGTPKAISKVTVYGSNTNGYVDGQTATVTITLYGKQTVPASGTDGTQLGQILFSDAAANGSTGRDVFSNDVTTQYRYVWIYITQNGPAANMHLAELQFFQWASATPQNLRRWNGNVYAALNDGNSGPNPPVHTFGDASTGQFNINWRWKHAGYGFVQITAVADAQHLTGNVLVPEQGADAVLPDSVVSFPTYRWWPPAWSPNAGWPNRVTLGNNELIWAYRDQFWITQPGDFNNLIFDATPASSIAGRMISPNGSLSWTEWIATSGVLVVGARDYEWIIRGPGVYDPITFSNVRLIPDTSEGSAPHVPALAEGGAVFVGRSRKRLHYVAFNPLAERMSVEELTKSARHILVGKAAGLAHQRDPNRIMWIWCQDGSLVSMTFMRQDQVIGFARHPLTNGYVEDVKSIPTSDEGASDVYLIVRRVINGVTRRFIEMLTPYFTPANPAAPDATGAWFLDCALQYTGAPATVITGLGYLEGQSVRAHADGYMAGNFVVTGGQIVLPQPASNVVVGLPIKWRARLLPLDLSSPRGSTKGQKKRATHAFVEMVNSQGGTITVNPDQGGQPNDLELTGGQDYGKPLLLFTGVKRRQVTAPLADQCIVELAGDDTMPFTLTGVTPDIDVAETA